MICKSKQNRPGLSLLEVLVALAIFMFSVVVISQMVDSGSKTALQAKRLTRAALSCESKMAEIVAGLQPLQSTGLESLPDPEPGWSFSVTCEPEEWTTVSVDGESVAGLNTVHVTVVWSSGRPGEELQYTLSRVVLDPRLRVPAPEPTISGSSPTQGGSP